MSIGNALASIVTRFGTTHTLRKAGPVAGPNSWTSGIPVPVYYSCRAHLSGYRPEEIKGGIADGDQMAVVEARTLPATPVAGDWLAIGTFSAIPGANWLKVVAVHAVRAGPSIVLYRLQIRGQSA